MTFNKLLEFDWQAVSAIANILLLGGLLFAYHSFKEMARTRNADLFLWVIQTMSSIKQPLKIIKTAPPYGTITSITEADFVSPWNPEIEEAAQQISVELQRISYLVNSGLLDKEHIASMWGPMVVEAWFLLELWVKRLRVKNKEGHEVFSRKDFEKLALELFIRYKGNHAGIATNES